MHGARCVRGLDANPLRKRSRRGARKAGQRFRRLLLVERLEGGRGVGDTASSRGIWHFRGGVAADGWAMSGLNAPAKALTGCRFEGR